MGNSAAGLRACYETSGTDIACCGSRLDSENRQSPIRLVAARIRTAMHDEYDGTRTSIGMKYEGVMVLTQQGYAERNQKQGRTSRSRFCTSNVFLVCDITVHAAAFLVFWAFVLRSCLALVLLCMQKDTVSASADARSHASSLASSVRVSYAPRNLLLATRPSYGKPRSQVPSSLAMPGTHLT